MPEAGIPPFLYFQGIWQLERTVYHKSTGAIEAGATGMASFQTTEAGISLQYREEGKIRLRTGSELSFHRRFLYQFTGEGMQVFFDDGPDAGKPYQGYIYEEAQKRLVPAAVHVCGPDLYQGEYLLSDSATFLHRTTIDGQAKDMRIETLYHRVS